MMVALIQRVMPSIVSHDGQKWVGRDAWCHWGLLEAERTADEYMKYTEAQQIC